MKDRLHRWSTTATFRVARISVLWTMTVLTFIWVAFLLTATIDPQTQNTVQVFGLYLEADPSGAAVRWSWQAPATMVAVPALSVVVHRIRRRR